jgi:hypothetical protein
MAAANILNKGVANLEILPQFIMILLLFILTDSFAAAY